MQRIAAGLGLRPDGLIGAGAVDEVFRRADGVDGGVLVVGRVGAFALGAHDVRLGDAGGQQRGADKPRGGQRGAAFRQQLQRKQRSGAEQQRAQREKAERELEHSHDLADGGAEPALDKIPREGVEREHERQHGKAGGSVQVLCGGACVPAGLGAPQAVKRQRKRQQRPTADTELVPNGLPIIAQPCTHCQRRPAAVAALCAVENAICKLYPPV